MTKTYFEDLMQELGCHTRDGIALGQWEGLPFSAQLARHGPPAQLVLRFVAAEKTRPLAARLNREKMAHTRWFAEDAKAACALVAVYAPPSDFYTKSGLYLLLGRVANLHKTGALCLPQQCPICHLGQCDAHAFLDEGYRPVHAACVQGRLALPQQDETVPARAGGHVLTGVLGALLGAFVGALPIWSFALSQGTIHWVLYAFIPILSGLCFRLLRGRASLAVAGVSVLASSLLAAFLLEQVWFWLVLSSTYSRSVPFMLSLQQYFATHTLVLAVQQMFTCLLALLAGYGAVTIFLRRYVQDGMVPARIIRGGDFVRDTMKPMGAKAPGPVAKDTNSPPARPTAQ